MKTFTNYIIKSPKNTFEPQVLSTHAIRSFYIVEDLEYPFLAAQLELVDLGGWVEQFPLTGNEIFEIELMQEIENPDNVGKTIKLKKVFEFEIYDIKSIPHDNKKGNIHTFILVEKGFFDYTGKYFSKSFKDKKISEIIKDICQNNLKFDKNKIEFDIEETSTKIDFIIPYWKTSTTIKYLSKIAARVKEPKEAGFLFFSSIGDKTKEKPIKKFISFATLLEQKPEVGEDTQFYLRDLSKSSTYMNNILEMSNPSVFNKIVIKSGIKGKTYYGLNLHENKSIIKEKIKLSEFVTEGMFLGDDTHFESDADDVSSDIQFKGYFNEDLIKNEMNFNFRMNFENINVREIYCRGVLDRYVGKIIFISEKSANPELLVNNLYSGTWCIKRIVHYITANSLEQKMTIIKNSFDKLEKNVNKPDHIRTKHKNV